MMNLNQRSHYLERNYTSNQFLPVIGLNKNTLHQWMRRKYFNTVQPGTGKALMLSGEEVFYLAALASLSKLGWSPSNFVFGLEKCSKEYFGAYLMQEEVMYRYGVAKGTFNEVEWGLFDNLNPQHHIVAANGQRVLPCWAIIDFQDLMERLLTGFQEVLKWEARKRNPESYVL